MDDLTARVSPTPDLREWTELVLLESDPLGQYTAIDCSQKCCCLLSCINDKESPTRLRLEHSTATSNEC